MSDLRQAAQQALEALDAYSWEQVDAARAALKAALAEPVQEPVQEVKGCALCSHPLYAGIKCRLCGKVTEPAPPPDAQTEAEKVAYCAGWWAALEKARKAEPVQEPGCRDDGMPTSAEERHLRRLLALRAAMPHAYYDDGEAQGTEHGIIIDFMREPVAHIDAKLRALNVARAIAKQAEPVQDHFPDATKMAQEPVADRAAFERHAERLGYSVDPDTREGREGGYWSSHTQLMWLTWQAAMAQRSAQPVQEPDSPERRCGGPGCDGTCCQPAQEPKPRKVAQNRLVQDIKGHA